MKKLTTKLALHAAFVALFATGTIMLPTLNFLKQGAIAGHAFAKDGDSGDSDSGGDGGNSGSGSDGGNSGSDSDGGHSGSGSDSRSSDSDSDSSDDGNSGSGSSHNHSDDSDDSSDDSSSNDANDDSSGRESRDRPEVQVSLSPEQIQAILGGQSKLVDNLGRTLELEIEIENGVTTYSAKPHGGDARRNPGPISNVSVVPSARMPVNGSTNDDGTPDQGSGDR